MLYVMLYNQLPFKVQVAWRRHRHRRWHAGTHACLTSCSECPHLYYLWIPCLYAFRAYVLLILLFLGKSADSLVSIAHASRLYDRRTACSGWQSKSRQANLTFRQSEMMSQKPVRKHPSTLVGFPNETRTTQDNGFCMSVCLSVCVRAVCMPPTHLLTPMDE